VIHSESQSVSQSDGLESVTVGHIYSCLTLASWR